jgi:hypothetical protein
MTSNAFITAQYKGSKEVKAKEPKKKTSMNLWAFQMPKQKVDIEFNKLDKPISSFDVSSAIKEKETMLENKDDFSESSLSKVDSVGELSTNKGFSNWLPEHNTTSIGPDSSSINKNLKNQNGKSNFRESFAPLVLDDESSNYDELKASSR